MSENNNKSPRIKKTILEKRFYTDINQFPKMKISSSQRIIINQEIKVKLKKLFFK